MSNQNVPVFFLPQLHLSTDLLLFHKSRTLYYKAVKTGCIIQIMSGSYYYNSLSSKK